LVQWGELILSEAKFLTPVDTGALKASGRTYLVPGLGVNIVFGEGGTVPYAVYVHENLAASHAPPGRAKFLETPLVYNVPKIATDLLRVMNKHNRSRSI
jgi:hypothetical protein